MRKKTFKYIKKNFLKLTKKTYPYGDETLLEEEGLLLDTLEQDQFGNYFQKIGDSRTIFASHLDTVSTTVEEVTHVFDEDNKYMVKTDGKTILGADDKAGVVLMYWMIKHNVPGLYYFFVGEEVGCFGSGQVANYLRAELEGKYDRVISFDRKGTDSIITFQSSYRTCSEKFSKKLAKQLNKTKGFSYKSDDTGSYTDSAEFTEFIPECTNLSVGYYSQHTKSERQDLKHLAKLADALLEVNWEKLPTKRDASVKEKKKYGYVAGRYRYDGRWSSQYSPNTNNYSHARNYTPSSNTGSYPSRSIVDDYEYTYDHVTRKVSVKPKDWNGSDSYKKTRRAGQKNKTKKITDGNGELFYVNGKNAGRRFYESGGDLIEIITNPDGKPNKGEFTGIKEKILLSNMTRQEIKTVKEQYLEASVSGNNKDYQKVIEDYGLVL